VDGVQRQQLLVSATIWEISQTKLVWLDILVHALCMVLVEAAKGMQTAIFVLPMGFAGKLTKSASILDLMSTTT